MTTSAIDADVIPTGRHWSFVMRRGFSLKLYDETGRGNVGMLLYNPSQPLERINVPDTLKCQHTFRLTTGHCIYSDMGRIFCSIIEDSAGWHDAVGGTCHRAWVDAKWGRLDFQEARNAYRGNGRDAFLIELAKYGLGRRDLAANLNLFSRIVADESGTLHFDTSGRQPGAHVVLRFEMDTLVILHTCPHPLDGAAEYPEAPVRYVIEKAPPMRDDDPCYTSRAENRRGFRNNAINDMHLSTTCGDHAHAH